MIKSDYFFDYQGIIQVHNRQCLSKSNYKFYTDSRGVQRDGAFIAIKGKSLDAFKFIESVLEKTELVIYESSNEKVEIVEKWAKNYSQICFVGVDSSEKYIQNLAYLHSEYCTSKDSFQFIGISGSNGKTTTKEMLRHLLEGVLPDKVIATKKNDNNHLGVPFTVLRIDPSKHQIAIVEYGSNHPGEMRTICNLTHPNIGITTNIGWTHMEYFETLEDVFDEEADLHRRVEEVTFGEGYFLINADDKHLKTLDKFGESNSFSLNESGDLSYQYNGKQYIEINGIKLENEFLVGEHNFLNLANAFSISVKLFPQLKDDFLRLCKSYKNTEYRSQWIEWNKKKVFFDAYNANLSSMKKSLEGFTEYCRNKSVLDPLIILGDMNELGDYTESHHEQLGKEIDERKEEIIFIGKFAEYFKRGIKNKKNYSIFESTADFINSPNYKKIQQNYIFAKASRSLLFEQIFDINSI